ncbi:MAG TPA: MBL fold metallo-hydrolase [Cyclobacteriaceae bacterium]|nr:MBL fold metallo-hydrolase [Cyclobacteriaceae bacterium]
MVIFALVIVILILSVYIFIQQPSFGKIATGDRYERIVKSPNYKNGRFSNLSHTPDLTEGVGFFEVLREFLFQKSKRSKPTSMLPSKKIDLKNLPTNENVIVWFGHSSYFLQIDGKKILVDPVLSGSASPVQFTTKSFAGADVYVPDDFPPIDYLFISHDHWDHLDYKTVKELKPKVKQVICGLGVGEHLERWGYEPSRIEERDWNEEVDLGNGFHVNTVPARHFSGRGFKRNQSLWLSYVLQTPTMKIFIGGDSGYDNHFEMIGKEHGPFDLAILECGQYDKSWKYIHMLPDEVVKAAIDLKATRLFPVHWAKFTLALHAWDDSIISVSEYASLQKVSLLTPMIGEPINLNKDYNGSPWWKTV